MTKVSVLRYAAIGMATLSLAGFAAASTVDFSTTGPDSTNKVNLDNSFTDSVSNHNSVGVGNLSAQDAHTGNVSAHNNTSVDGDMASGDANNSNASDTSVKISNTSANSGLSDTSVPNDSVRFDTTGPDSENRVDISNSAKVETRNTNDVNVLNLNLQSAKSGNVSANNNTTVGGLASGDASNTNTSTTAVEISN